MSEQEPKAKTFEDWKSNYDDSEAGSQEEAEALAKMAELATTREQWNEVYWCADANSELEARAEVELAKFDQ